MDPTRLISAKTKRLSTATTNKTAIAIDMNDKDKKATDEQAILTKTPTDKTDENLSTRLYNPIKKVNKNKEYIKVYFELN